MSEPDKYCEQCENLAQRLLMAEEHIRNTEAEVQKLVYFIATEIAGEPSRPEEGACATAIRVMREMKEALGKYSPSSGT